MTHSGCFRQERGLLMVHKTSVQAAQFCSKHMTKYLKSAANLIDDIAFGNKTIEEHVQDYDKLLTNIENCSEFAVTR